MGFSTLTQFDLGASYHLLNTGLSHNKIALELGVSKSTISYELKRVTPYNPTLAQLDADNAKERCGRHSVLNPKLSQLIENHLQLTHSLEAIAHQFHLCTSSIYNWIYTGLLDLNPELLPDKNLRQKREGKRRGIYQVGRTIEDRPEVANHRSEFGHWKKSTLCSLLGVVLGLI